MASGHQHLHVVFADVSVNATFRGFTPDRIIHAPTDINLIIARVQVMSNSDTAAANSLNQAITLAAYNTSGKHFCLAQDALHRTVTYICQFCAIAVPMQNPFLCLCKAYV